MTTLSFSDPMYRLVRNPDGTVKRIPEKLWGEHGVVAYCLSPANANGQQWFTAAAILERVQAHCEQFSTAYVATLPNARASLAVLQQAGFVEALDMQTALNVVQEAGRLLDQVQRASWDTLALLAEALDWPTEGPFAEMLWRKSNYDDIAAADAGMKACGYIPFVGYPLQLIRDDDITITKRIEPREDGTVIYYYDFNAIEFSIHRRRRAHRLARAEVEADFDPEELAGFNVGVRGVGYVVDTTPIPDCTCGLATDCENGGGL